MPSSTANRSLDEKIAHDRAHPGDVSVSKQKTSLSLELQAVPDDFMEAVIWAQ